MADGEAGFTASSRVLAPEEVAGEYMLNALRLNRGFSLTQFNARTGLSAGRITPLLDDLCNRGLLALDQGQVSTTALGRRFLDDVVAAFFPD